MATYTTTATGAQDGYTFAGVWDDTSASMPFYSGVWLGLQFVAYSTFDAEGRPVDPLMIYPSFDLTLSASLVPSNNTFSVWFVPEAAPAPYSLALPPGSRNETRLTGGVWTAGSLTRTITVPTTTMLPWLRNSSWNGIISLSLTSLANVFLGAAIHTAEGADPTLAPSIETTEVSAHTGFWEGPAFGRRARFRHCPRSGLPVASDQMVKDGYVIGQMVSPEMWEPEDEDDHYVPSPLEGVVDDET